VQVGQTQEQHMNRLRQTLVKGQLAKKVMHYGKGLGGCISCSWDIESIVLYNGVEWYTADVKWCHGKSLASTGNLTDDVNVDFRQTLRQLWATNYHSPNTRATYFQLQNLSQSCGCGQNIAFTPRPCTIRDAISTCNQKLTQISLIYYTEPTTTQWKNRKTKK